MLFSFSNGTLGKNITCGVIKMNIDIVTNISIYEIVSLIFSVIGGLATLVAAAFALWQWHQTTKLKRAELIRDALVKIRDDKEIAQVLYVIDYGEESWYNEDFLDDHEQEAQFDRAFAFFDYLCYLRKRRILRAKDFKVFEYRIVRMAINEDVKKYLFNLYHFSKANGTYCSFDYLLGYMRKQKLLPNDFYNREARQEEKLLNY